MPAPLLSATYAALPAARPGDGAVATVYLDTTRSVQNAPTEIELRWRALRAGLADAGADGPTLDALGGAVGSHHESPGPQGQVLVAAGGQVHYDTVLPHPPRRDTARWAPLPHLMPLVAQYPPVVPYVLVVADRIGADIRVHRPDQDQHHAVTGRDWPIHKAKTGGWRELRYQHRVENAWSENARQVAEAVTEAVAGCAARLVVLAGDERARHEVRRVLDERSRRLLQEVAEGGRAAGADAETLERRVEQLVAEVVAADDAAVVQRFEEEIGQQDRAAAGLAPTLTALRQAQVETLLVVDDPSSTEQAWIGPEPTQLAGTAAELRELGVAEPVRDRLDAALVRTAAGTGAGICTLAHGQLELPDGVGALLRYATSA